MNRTANLKRSLPRDVTTTVRRHFSASLVTSRSVNQPLVRREPVEPSDPVMVSEFVPRARSPPETVKPPVALATVMLAVPSNETPPIVRAVCRAVAVPALPVIVV